MGRVKLQIRTICQTVYLVQLINKTNIKGYNWNLKKKLSTWSWSFKLYLTFLLISMKLQEMWNQIYVQLWHRISY